MNKIKEMLIRKGLNFKLINVEEDRVEVKFEKTIKMKEEYKEYLYLLDEVPEVIKGVKKVSLDINDQKAIIVYDNKILNTGDIESLLLDIKEFVIEQWDFVSDSKEEDTKKIIAILKNKLKDRISKR